MRFPHDVTLPLDAGTPRFPGDPAIHFVPVRRLESGDPYRLSALAMGSHSGTHLDAPSHFIAGGRTVDTVDLDLLNGPAHVVVVAPDVLRLGPEELSEVPRGTRRLLLRTRNSFRWASGAGFEEPFAALDATGAQFLLDRGVGLVGVDGLSVESDPRLRFPVHHLLLGHGIWILEGLNLADVTAGSHELRCLPLRLTGVDGSPCRAALWS